MVAAKRRADVQGLRALAVLLVVSHHGGFGLQGGFIGVDVFFVISGYVIARMLLAELVDVGDLSFATFYSNRARRLLPALAVLLVVICASSAVLLGPLGPQQQVIDTATSASTFTANVQLFLAPKGYFDPDTKANALLHLWSLSVEEQFYFVFPVLLLLAWRIAVRFDARRARTIVAALVIAASVISFAVSWSISNGHFATLIHRFGGGTSEFAFYIPITRVWEFGAGIVIAILGVTLRTAWVATCCALLGLGLVGLGAITTRVTDPFPGVHALLPVIGTTLLLVAGTSASAVTTRLLSSRLLVFFGNISYSWYLWHWPLIVFVDAFWPGTTWLTFAAGLASIIPAWISFRYVEQPLRISAGKSTRQGFAIAAASITISLAAALFLRVASSHALETEPVRFLATALELHANEVHGCSNGAYLDSKALERCTWIAGAAKGTIVLVGDSNAGHFTEPVAAAAATAGYTFTVATRPSCPFVELGVLVPGRDTAACRAFVGDTIDKLAARKPALVIIASASTTYVNSRDIAFVDPKTGARTSTIEAKARLWEAGVRAIVGRLAAERVPTIVIHSVPQLTGLSLPTCPYVRIRHDVRACGIAIAREHIDRQQLAARVAEQAATAGLRGVSTIDVTDALCSPTHCDALRDETWLYRDEGHLTVRAAVDLAPRIARAIADAVLDE